jgi:hypothetical protein
VAAEGFVELWRNWEQVSGFDRPGAVARSLSRSAEMSMFGVRLRHTLPAPLVDIARFDRGTLVFATADQAIAAYSIEASSTAGATPSPG